MRLQRPFRIPHRRRCRAGGRLRPAKRIARLVPAPRSCLLQQPQAAQVYAVSRAMAREPDDRYQSYAEFIEQLEDAKRRITDPEFREKQAEDVVILDTPSTAKFWLWGMVGLVVVVVLLGGLLIWKGSALFQPKEAINSELNGYTPKGTSH